MTAPEDMSRRDEMKISRRDEMETLLPFYLNGTLSGDDLAAVEKWLATDPAASSALEEAEAEFSGTYASNEAVRLPADALSRFAKALDAEAGPVRAPAEPSLIARLWERFMAVPVTVAWAAAAAAVALVLVQAVVQPGGRGPDFEIAGSDDLAKMPFVFVTFKPDARMADITKFLADNGAVVIAGPAAGGAFKIGIPAKTVADYDRVVGHIAAQPFADSVVPGRKPSDGG